MAGHPMNIIIVPPREVKIQRFHGDSHASLVERFIEEVQVAWRARKDLSAEERKDLLWEHLGESVKEELRCRGNDLEQDPEATLILLRDIYGEKRSIPQLMAQFQRVVQSPNETVRSYSHRLHQAFRLLTARQTNLHRAPVSPVFLRDQFVQNLNQPSVRRQLEEMVFCDQKASFIVLRDAAIRWAQDECPGRESKSVTTLNTRPDVQTFAPPTTSNLEDRVDNLAAQISSISALVSPRGTRFAPDKQRPTVRSRSCFKCHQLGHIASNCYGNIIMYPAFNLFIYFFNIVLFTCLVSAFLNFYCLQVLQALQGVNVRGWGVI
ncbi:uncharacterized protein LOC131931153 [Physella acuta]|uniref:uncharacterized protein LOC131931153 n=1 Tax=Physella acuta TaxID=109671 RepID=UPI0027DBA993|nr:uncharacterized protein LOC131931153 [Physella acuta]